MATTELNGTKFGLTPSAYSDEEVRVRLCVENERVSYTDENALLSCEELEDWLCAASRLLAGGYEREYSLSFERAGLAVDFYAYTQNGKSVSRVRRREEDCVMAVRLLMRSKDGSRFLGGVYTLLLHRTELENFVEDLQREYAEICVQRVHGMGKYLFVGVSPFGYRGCNYRYLDPTGTVVAGEYVWVRMGRHNTEQIVCVDSARYYGEEDAPFSPARVKQVLRKATAEEIETWKNG